MEITVTYTRKITDAARAAARTNGAKAKAIVQTEEHRAKLRAAQQKRREREKQERAADLWAEGRNTGRATADPHALDGDAILSAQVLTDDEDISLCMVATINVKHLVGYVANAAEWQDITP
jgi:hypothetical protein